MADNWQLKAVLSANAESMLRTLKFVNQATKTTRKYLMDVGSSATNLAGRVGLPLGLISGALGALSFAGIKAAVTSFAELGDHVVKSAHRRGVTTDEYQRLKYAAGQSGVSVEGLGSSVGRLNKGIAMAASGKNKDLAALFQRTGISMRDASGHLRSGADLLPEVAELFKENTNAATQARMGTAIFGKSWQELAPLLQGGKEGIDELNKRYEALGLAVDGKALKAGEAFGDQLEDLEHVTKSYGNTIASKLIPIFSPMLESTIKWAVANRELIAVPVSKFIADMAVELSNVDWSTVIKDLGDFVTGIKDFIGWVGGAKYALIGLAIIMNAQTISAVIGLGVSVGKLAWSLGGPLVSAVKLAWLVMGACPVLVIIAAVILLATMIYQNWDSIVAYVGSAWQRVKDVFSVNFFDGIIQVYLEAWQGLANAILGIIKTITPDFLMPEAMKNFNFTFASDHARNVVSDGRVIAADRSAPLATGERTSFGNPSLPMGNGERPSLVRNAQQDVGGKFTFDFQNAPPGMRLAGMQTTGKTDVDMNVGTRSYALD
jgi:hypothetical protein